MLLAGAARTGRRGRRRSPRVCSRFGRSASIRIARWSLREAMAHPVWTPLGFRLNRCWSTQSAAGLNRCRICRHWNRGGRELFPVGRCDFHRDGRPHNLPNFGLTLSIPALPERFQRAGRSDGRDGYRLNFQVRRRCLAPSARSIILRDDNALELRTFAALVYRDQIASKQAGSDARADSAPPRGCRSPWSW